MQVNPTQSVRHSEQPQESSSFFNCDPDSVQKVMGMAAVMFGCFAIGLLIAKRGLGFRGEKMYLTATAFSMLPLLALGAHDTIKICRSPRKKEPQPSVHQQVHVTGNVNFTGEPKQVTVN